MHKILALDPSQYLEQLRTEVLCQDTHSDQTQREIIFVPTCIKFVRHALVRLPVLHFLLLLLLLELLLLPLGEFPLEAGVLLRGLADVAGLVNPPEQEPALPVVVVPAELHQQRLLVQADPPLSGLVDLNTTILL